jgi:hypothetical protein
VFEALEENGMNRKIYLHEIIKITKDNRANYFEHMTVNWAPAMKERKQKLVGIFSLFTSSGDWPYVINLWEYDGWAGIAGSFDFETANVKTLRDPFFAEWSKTAYEYRQEGQDRIVIAAEYSPTIDELIATGNIGHKLYYHERISIQPGRARDYLALLQKDWLPQANELGMQLIGAYRTSGRKDSEAIVIWALKDWAGYARLEEAFDSSPVVKAWEKKTQDMVVDWRREVLIAAPYAPIRTGKHLAELA